MFLSQVVRVVFDGVVKSPIYCALVSAQTFDVPGVLLQAWPDMEPFP